MKLSKHSLTWTVALGLGALAWLSPLPALAGDNVWTSDGSPGPNITGVALDPADARTIYAVSEVGWIFKSVDGGANWTELGGGDPLLHGLVSLAVDSSNSSNVYVGSALGIVANSHDSGATWSKATVSSNSERSIAVEPATGSVYAATRLFLARSTDGGSTWFPAGLHASNDMPRRAYALLADALQKTLFVGTDFAYSGGYYGGHWVGGGVARTTNAGVTWTLPATDLRSPVTALAADPSGGLVYAGTSSGQIFRSGNAGVNWIRLGQMDGGVATIAVDPAAASTLYATTYGGVWRSSDGGATWRRFESGLYPGGQRSLTSLAIDPSGRTLYAGTDLGLFHREIPAPASGPCEPGADHLCLLGSRFRVDLRAIDPRTQAPAPVQAIAQADRFGYFSFPTLTGDPSLPEVFVKMLDATSLPGQGYWLFSSALTNVPYSLAVTDTATGRMQLYDGQAFCGTADTQAFPPGESSAIAAGSIGTSGALEASGVELALLSRRFRIALSATDPSTGTTVSGAAIPQGDRFGYFSLPAFTGDASFPEVFVKMLDATSLPDGDFWLFQAGLTTLPYTLTVTDSATGAVKTYQNDPSDPTRLCGSADIHVTRGAVTEFPFPTFGGFAWGIAAGPDGNLWFTELWGNKIGRITTGGVVTEFPIPNGDKPDGYGIAAGPDGNLWFTMSTNNKIGRITTGGAITEFSIPTALSKPTGIAAGPDGNLWFTEYAANQIGRITTAGVITEFPVPGALGGLLSIAAGPDGNLWFTDPGASQIGRITTSGVVTEFPISAAPGEGIAAGPDGNLWFTEYAANQIGRITTAGVVTEYPIPTALSHPRGIAAGPDGNMWFSEYDGNTIGRITTAGVITEYPIPKAFSYPGGIATGPDGNLWFTEANAIGRIMAVP